LIRQFNKRARVSFQGKTTSKILFLQFIVIISFSYLESTQKTNFGNKYQNYSQNLICYELIREHNFYFWKSFPSNAVLVSHDSGIFTTFMIFFYVHGTVHLSNTSYINTNEMQLFFFLFGFITLHVSDAVRVHHQEYYKL